MSQFPQGPIILGKIREMTLLPRVSILFLQCYLTDDINMLFPPNCIGTVMSLRALMLASFMCGPLTTTMPSTHYQEWLKPRWLQVSRQHAHLELCCALVLARPYIIAERCLTFLPISFLPGPIVRVDLVGYKASADILHPSSGIWFKNNGACSTKYMSSFSFELCLMEMKKERRRRRSKSKFSCRIFSTMMQSHGTLELDFA